MTQKDTPQPKIEIPTDILQGAKKLLSKYAGEHGIEVEDLITQLSLPTDQVLVEPESKEPMRGEVRLARMGWTKELPTAEETEEARSVIESIQKIARFGYQIPAYALTKQESGKFSGIAFPGMQNQLSSIWSTLDHIKEKQGDTIESLVPNCMELDYLKALNLPYDAKFADITKSNTQRVVVIKQRMKDQNSKVCVLGVPSIDANPYGYPPYSQITTRPSKALQFIEFNSVEERQKFEELLSNHPNPLKFLNAMYSALFSPDTCTNLVGSNDRNGASFIMKNSEPVGYEDGMEDALGDFAGLGFHYQLSEERGGNNKPLID